MKLFNRISSLALALLAMFVIMWCDRAVGVEINLWVLYCVPIAILSWNRGRKTGFLFAGVAALMLTFTGLFWGYLNTTWLFFAIAVASKVLVYFIVVLFVGALRVQQVERIFTPSKKR